MAAGCIISIVLILAVAMDLATNQAAAQTTDIPTDDPITANPVTSVSLEEVPLTFTSPSDTFTTDLLDSTTTAYQTREANIKNKLEPVFETAYSSFSSLAVTGFSSGSVINSIMLKFQSGSVPGNSEIETTLSDAASSITGLEIDTSSIIVGTSITQAPTTAMPNTPMPNTAMPTTMTIPIIINVTTPMATTAIVPTTPETVEVVSHDLTWTSPNDIFTPDLLDPTSQGFQDRANLIKDRVEPVYQTEYDSFDELTVLGFRSGSVINNVRLTFKNTSVPEITETEATFIMAAANLTGIEVDTNTVIVTLSSGVRHNISLVTACSLALLPWLLSRQQ